MNSFNYAVPTRIYFGEDKINALGIELSRIGSRMLLVYGGGSIKANGIYDKVLEQLEETGILFWELSGVDPNPKIETVKAGIDLCRRYGIDGVVALGGGSTIDAAKLIAAGALTEEDPWLLVKEPGRIRDALPVAVVLTLAATGSEMDPIAVISNPETKEKIGTRHPALFPRFSILDPTYTYTVPAHQTAAGTVDIMSHALEEYFSGPQSAYISDRLAEGVLKTCVHYGPIAYKEPENYEARSNLMWASSLAINGLLKCGKESVWCIHPMEHELSAYYDITHGVGLGILIPVWLEYILSPEILWKFRDFAVHVWGLSPELEDSILAEQAIANIKGLFSALGIPSKLSEVGIDETHLEAMAAGATRNGLIGGVKKLSQSDVLEIFKRAL